MKREVTKHPSETVDKARQLVIAGLTNKQVAERCGVTEGVVKVWRCRKKWVDARDKAIQKGLDRVSDAVLGVAMDEVLQHKERIQRVIKAKIDTLEQFKEKKASDFAQIANGLKTLDDVGRRNLGLAVDDKAPVPSVTFNMGLRPLPAKVEELPEAQIVVEKPLAP